MQSCPFWARAQLKGDWLHQAATTATTVGIVVITRTSLEDGKETQGTETKQSTDQSDRTGCGAQFDELAHLPTALFPNVTKNCAAVEIFSEI